MWSSVILLLLEWYLLFKILEKILLLQKTYFLSKSYHSACYLLVDLLMYYNWRCMFSRLVCTALTKSTFLSSIYIYIYLEWMFKWSLESCFSKTVYVFFVHILTELFFSSCTQNILGPIISIDMFFVRLLEGQYRMVFIDTLLSKL